MSRDKKDLHNELVNVHERASDKYKEMYPSDPQPFLTCTHRSNDEQNALFEIGRTKPGKKVTNAKGGESPHNFLPSLAYDIGFITIDKKLSWDKKYFSRYAEIVRGLTDSVTCGIDFQTLPDAPHFELRAWKTLKENKVA